MRNTRETLNDFSTFCNSIYVFHIYDEFGEQLYTVQYLTPMKLTSFEKDVSALFLAP